jgi:hypothetical protein
MGAKVAHIPQCCSYDDYTITGVSYREMTGDNNLDTTYFNTVSTYEYFTYNPKFPNDTEITLCTCFSGSIQHESLSGRQLI